jgi:phage portal protein BeeE
MNSKETMKLAAKQTGVKEIAQALGVAPSTLYNQMNDEDKVDILQRFVDFSNLCANDVAISWACEQLGGSFTPNLKIDNYQTAASECVARSLKEFSDVIRAIGDAIADGKITLEEAESIRKEWQDLKSLMESFVLACETGYHDRGE